MVRTRKRLGLTRNGLIPHRISTNIPASKIKEDLERYRAMAIELGAEDAVVIPTEEIIIDERVRAKCITPKCSNYGNNINCPPFAPDLPFMRKVIESYHNAILFSVKGNPSDFTGPRRRKRTKGNKQTKYLLNRICSEIESRAFYEGYHLSLAFGQGPCKSFWCPDQPCAALQPGKGCRFPLKARSSMEAVGMDVFAMAAHRGWEIYPCGDRVDANQIPHVLLVGIVLIS
jgi:predicted metal-binding protein